MSHRQKSLLVRLSGTVSTKSSRVRRRFSRRLEANIRDALDRNAFDYTLRREWSRLFVDTDEDAARLTDILRRIPGIQSIRPSERVAWESLQDIVDHGAELFGGAVDGKTFGVRTRRVGQREHFDFDSRDVNVELGGALDGPHTSVDLDDPDVPVSLEVHPEDVYFYTDDVPGPGGLPVGTQKKALALVSGGFDSAVAVWQMLKRGVDLDFCFFNLGGAPHERGVREVMGGLVERCGFGWDPDIHIIDFRPLLAELKVNVPGNYWQVVLKRVMMRAGAAVAEDLGLPVMVTGEAIGQVSTQTLANLAAIERSPARPIDVPIFRPLLSFNKEEITGLARDIGVYNLAKDVPEFCALEGGKPVTRSTPEKLDDREALMDLSLIDTLADDRRVERMRDLAAAEEQPDVRIDHVPEGAAVLDLRPEQQFDSWHYPEAMNVPFATAIEQYPALPKPPTWVLYCDVGLKSALLAEKMRRAGFQAHSFKGGVPRLRRWMERQEA